MLKLIKHLLTDKAIYIALTCSFLILTFSLIPMKVSLMGKAENSDKILHTFSYILLSLSWLFYFKPTNDLKIKLSVAVGVFVFGMIIEMLQSSLTTYRTGSFYDVVANTVGIVFALIIYKSLKKLIFLNN